MKKVIGKPIIVAAALLALAACSTTRHHGGSGDMMGDGGTASTSGLDGDGTYAEGAGSGTGFQPSANCNVPQTASRTQSYYFDYDKSEVHPEDISHLQALASNAAANHAKLNVVGNTDNRGSREYNMALGWRRANTVTSALAQAGVSKQQITTNSNGAEKPISFGNSEDDFQCNRRVDVSDKG